MAIIQNPQIPEQNEKPITVLLGASGTQFFRGFYNISDADEYVKDLQGSKALQVYNRMRRNDAQVKMALLALTNPIVNATWDIEASGDPEQDNHATPEEEAAARFISECWFDESFNWEQVLRQILSMFWAGFSCFEKYYIVEDGKIKLKKLCPRLQNTIVEWDVKDEKLIQIKQYIPAGETARTIWIPAEKLALFVYDQEGDDFRGQSVLRPAYKHWYMKDTFYRIQAIKIERWCLGVPVVSQSEGTQIANPNRDAAVEMVENLRAHEKGYAYVPKGFNLEMLDSGNAKMVNEQEAIDHHDKKILMATLSQFLELGVNDTGSRAVGQTLKDFCLQGLSFAANLITEVINVQIFREWTLWNFGPNVRPPKLCFTGIQPEDLELLASAYSKLVTSGAVEMDDPTEAHFRDQLGLPPKDPNTVRTPQEPTPTGNGTQDNNTNDGQNDQQPVDGTPPTNQYNAKPRSRRRYRANNPMEIAQPGLQADTYIHFWRELRESEESVALREIVGRLDDTKERIVKITRTTRLEVVDSLMIQVSQAYRGKDSTTIKKIDYAAVTRNALANEVMDLLNDLWRYGRDQVYRELDQQQRLKAADTNLDELKRLAKQYLRARADAFAEISLDRLVDEARVQAGNAIRTGLYDESVIRDILSTFSDNTTRRSASYTVNDAFGLGRRQGAGELKDQIAYAEYSAILDNGTCVPCERLDGRTFEIDSPEYQQYSPPLSTCEGGAQCRCIWVYVMKEERPAQA